MASKENVYVIGAGLLERRTSKTGKQRYTINVKAEPVLVNLDPKTIGAEVTKAVIHHLKQAVLNITATVAPRTAKARKAERAGYARGEPWAIRRYEGGRTGATPPQQSDRAFNSSGRLANSITGNASSDGSWRINVASNRLTDRDSGGAQRIWQRLVQLVPEFGDPRRLLENDIVRKGVERARDGMVKKMRETRQGEVAALVRSVIGLVKEVGDLIEIA